jgi:transcriptional regulator with GAF, ATPase, and Fis domain
LPYFARAAQESVVAQCAASSTPTILSAVVSDFEDDVTRRVGAQERGVRIPSVELVVVDGPSRGTRFPVEGGVAKIGSSPGSQLCVIDETVSRVHCEVRVRAGEILVRDLGSTNGTLLDGVRIREAFAAGGSVLRLGNSAVRVEVGEEPSFVEVSERSGFGELVGASLDMRRLYAVLERVAPTDTTLLIQGETGTGKDVVARSLHAASHRANGPFVPVDCGAIPESLFESELFGHVRGAFSGAVADRKGVFEEAAGGTLFLDEIGELPLSLQPKLLRAIETRAIRRVGSNAERPVDVRIVAATNRPLARFVNEGSFREDLYYRLAVVEVTVPPLRARKEDIPILAHHFHARLRSSADKLPDDFVAMLSTRSWPGNVRELKNFIERSVSLGFVQRKGAAPSAPPVGSLESMVPVDLPLKDARQAWMDSFESVYVRTLLKKTGGNVTRAAEAAGVSRRFLQRMLARLGVRAADADGDDE